MGSPDHLKEVFNVLGEYKIEPCVDPSNYKNMDEQRKAEKEEIGKLKKQLEEDAGQLEHAEELENTYGSLDNLLDQIP